MWCPKPKAPAAVGKMRCVQDPSDVAGRTKRARNIACAPTMASTAARMSSSAAGIRTQGVVLCHQVRTLDSKERGARWVETLPAEIVEDVLARVRTLLD